MRVTTFSRQFPGYHPRKGELTHFPEMILNKVLPGWHKNNKDYFNLLLKLNKKNLSIGKLTEEDIHDFSLSLHRGIEAEKHHTIRAGNRRKQGQFFHPVVWSGRPYFDPQIIFAPPVEIKKVWEFEIDEYRSISSPFIGDKDYYDIIPIVAKNDGLYLDDFEDWLKLHTPTEKYKPFSGQIICWDENVKY